jgi:hypothetical protein
MAEHETVLPPARYEHQDVVFRYMVIGFAGTFAAILLNLLLVMWLYPSIAVDKRLAGPLPAYPQPRLQSDPAADMRKFLHSELNRLNSAGWVDRGHGIAHIPIKDAMQRIAQQGIPDWPKEPPP